MNEPDPDRCEGECVTRPHRWSPSGARCTRTGCDVVGTGDPCNDGNCEGAPDPEVAEQDQPFTPFVASVLEQGAAISASITNAAVDALQHENKKLKAQLALIYERVYDLAHEPMTPMLGRDLVYALTPEDWRINAYIKDHLEK